MPVSFHHQTPSHLPDKKRLKAFIKEIFQNEGKQMESLSFILCTDEYLLEINRQFLNHDYYTDIITFNLAGVKRPVIGDVYISIDRVRENAKSLGQPVSTEILRVIFHGALHLCGYKDKAKKDVFTMRKKEDEYLLSYFRDVPREKD